jgi:molybdopterin-guanine dinucleotide biosynthesis protein A
MSNRPGISGAILAGGKSKRMGEDKALVKIRNTTLIERAVQAMKPVISRPMIITNAPEKFNYLNLPLYHDVIPNLGPLGGIYTALNYATDNYVLVMACDLPNVTTRIIQELWNRGGRQDILVLDAGFGLEPLCAVYSKRCIPIIKDQIEKGELKVTDFFPKMQKVEVLKLKEIDDSLSGRFLNVNTPADRRLAEKIFGSEDH